jgi:single-stranded DNA-specific DHH superfamily exonuclease
MQLVDAARGAATRLRALPADARVRIVAHLDADGISSAAIVLKALLRERRQFHVTYTAEHGPAYFEGLDHEPYEANVFVDIGATALPSIARLSGLQIVLDHHAPLGISVEAHNLCVVNPHMVGDDGVKDACGATTTFAFALALSEANWDLAAHALVGAFGDRQERGGFTGWNAYVLTQAMERGFVELRTHLAIGYGPLLDALRFARPPWDRAAIKDPAQFLQDHSLAPEATVLELPRPEAETLASALIARLLAGGMPGHMVKDLFVEVPHSKAHEDAAIPRLVNLASAAAREGDPGLGLATLLGDPNARRDLEALEARYHQTIRGFLRELQTNGAQTLRGLQVFQVPQVAYAGEVSGLAMEYVLPRTHATLAFAPLGDQIRCSARGTAELVTKGLDLGVALRQAATGVGGIGGGHSIASGATVARERFDEFLARADDIIARQLGTWP